MNTVESLADMTPEQLEAIEGIGPKTVEKISIAVNNYFASLDGGEAVAAETESAGEAATEAAVSEAGVSEAGIGEESLAEGSVEADALAEPENTGEAESPAEGELEAARLAAEAEPSGTAPAEEVAEAATEEALEDKQN